MLTPPAVFTVRAPLCSEKQLNLAVGIVGALVMPHNIFLHSALVQSRKIDTSHAGAQREAILYNAIESLDRNQIEAARDLGASWPRIHARVEHVGGHVRQRVRARIPRILARVFAAVAGCIHARIHGRAIHL